MNEHGGDGCLSFIPKKTSNDVSSILYRYRTCINILLCLVYIQCWHDVESDYIHWTIYMQSILSTLWGKPCNY